MKMFRTFALAGLLALSLGYCTAPAFAATAHNSQAGANGNTSNAKAPLHKHMMMHMKHMKKM